MYRLKIYGAFRLADPDGADIPLRSRKAMALLAYLALAPAQTRSREEIMALLWSDRGEAQARASLRQVLTGLRKDLGGASGILQSDNHRVALNAGRIVVDSPDGEELLAGFHLSDPAFEEWLRDERLRIEDALAPSHGQRVHTSPEKPCVAILPFANLSEDPGQHYFADGLTEDMITELSRFRTLSVIGRSSAFAVGDQATDVGDAGNRLGANYLVQGSVRRAGDRVRVTAQLVDVVSGAHIWADRYDRDLRDIFAVQDDVVASVVAKLGLSLSDIETSRVKDRPTQSLNAYDLLLRARSAWWHGRDDKAHDLTRQSVEADPGFAIAHAYFALQHAYQFYSGSLGLTNDQIAEKCRHHAETALALDDTDPIVHAYASMAFGFSPLAAKERGLRHSDIAIGLNPHDCELMLFHAWQLAFAGRLEEALELLEKIKILNPLGGYMMSECYADIYYMLGEYEKALDSYRDQPGAPAQALGVFVACHARMGRVDAAQACLAELERIKPKGFDVAKFATAQCVTCLREEDRRNWRLGFQLAGIETG